MGATSFERMRRARAARDIIDMLKGCDLEAFRAEFSLPCDPTDTGIEEALTRRSDYVELKERAAEWVAAGGNAPKTVDPEPEGDGEQTEQPEAPRKQGRPRRGSAQK